MHTLICSINHFMICTYFKTPFYTPSMYMVSANLHFFLNCAGVGWGRCVPIARGGQRLGVLFNHSPSHFLRQDLSLTLALARLAGQQVLEFSCFCGHMHKTAPAFRRVLGIRTQAFTLIHLTH